MRNLDEPSRDGAEATLERALSQYKYRGQILGYAGSAADIASILELYDEYDAARGVANASLKGPSMHPDLKQAVHDAYDQTQKNRRLKQVRAELFRGVDLCPVCGIDPPAELDHVLPRSEYPALAIYVRNLVPLCHACNHTKLAGFAEPGQLGFVHAYFDIFPDVQFLNVNIELRGSALVATFFVNAEAVGVGDLGDRVGNIHVKLALNDRYQRELNLFLSGHAISLHGAFLRRGGAGVEAYLRGQAMHESDQLYRNHWRPVLLNALAGHETFCSGGFQAILPVADGILRIVYGDLLE